MTQDPDTEIPVTCEPQEERTSHVENGLLELDSSEENGPEEESSAGFFPALKKLLIAIGSLLSHQQSFREVGWQSHQDMITRFEVLCGIGNLSHQSVFDIGCGLADFYLYLQENFQHFTYFGIDLIEKYHRENLRRFQAEDNCHFFHGNFAELQLPKVDYIIASGALSYSSGGGQGYLQAMIRKSFAECQKGFAFNLLDARHFTNDRLLSAYHPGEILDFCHSLTPDAELIQGYIKHDFTIHLRHPHPEAQ